MNTLLSLLHQKVAAAMQAAFLLPPEELDAVVVPCMQEQFGHYQCNSALKLAKTLKISPHQVAKQILAHFDSSICEKIEVAGAGFINFTLSSHFLSEEITQQQNDRLLGASPPEKQERIIVEFSSPNVAKELHIGHIRSTIIGDSIARLLEFLGYDVLRLNHIGDWGTQFGMLITYMKQAVPDVLRGETPTTLEHLMKWYRESKKEFDLNPDFKKRAQLEVVQLQSGDSETLQYWNLLCEISRIGFQEIYDLLDVNIQERGESFYNPFLKEVVDAFEQKGLVQISDGAKCLYLDGFKNREGEPLPMIIQKSDGGYNYDTTDLAAFRHRIFVEKADRIIVLTDTGQSLHFQMLVAAIEKIGWLDPKKLRFDHVGFGLVLGPDGKKFKTRSGTTEKLIDLLIEAETQAKSIVQERLPDATPEELEQLAHVIGIGAVKYADLSSCRTKDYTFSYDRMLRFEGNTAVFLLYAYVRINGIKKKAGISLNERILHPILLQHPSEIGLALHIRRFGETVDAIVSDLYPHRLTEYLYTLAEKFNLFFRDCQVVGSKEEKSRLALCDLTSRLLKQGLEILGLKTVERM
ncbi:MAG: arginine--tRNA ligase [Chlamydiia bacterium]|nr:arginine--tRNA ligase [Chlamydiia bacterium]